MANSPMKCTHFPPQLIHVNALQCYRRCSKLLHNAIGLIIKPRSHCARGRASTCAVRKYLRKWLPKATFERKLSDVAYTLAQVFNFKSQLSQNTLCSEKTPTYSFFHISMNDVQI